MGGSIGNHLTSTTSSVILKEWLNHCGNSLGSSELAAIGTTIRGVAQFGRALALGASGRRFKSFHPDLHTYYNYAFLFCGVLAGELGNFDGKS